MSSIRRQIGAILLESGRITPADVERVLEYQRQHGGFFGQALVTLGIVSREELDWALANQLDIPYIFPNAAAVDPDAVALVPPDWALAHLAVPILRAGNSLTIVSAEPLDDEAIEYLRATTGYEIELALASANRVRELIHVIYGPAEPASKAAESLSVFDLIARAVDAGTDALGISARAGRAIAWYRAGNVHRFRLQEGWENLLNQLLSPAPGEMIPTGAHGVFDWDARLRTETEEIGVHVRALVSGAGAEYLLTPSDTLATRTDARPASIPDAIATELRILYRSGPVRIGVTGSDPALVRTLLPQLPRMFAGPDIRAIHLADEPAPGVYAMRIVNDPAFVESLRAFQFDAVTIDTKQTGAAFEALMDVAPFRLIAAAPAQPAEYAPRGFAWILKISPAPSGFASWELVPVGS